LTYSSCTSFDWHPQKIKWSRDLITPLSEVACQHELGLARVNLHIPNLKSLS